MIRVLSGGLLSSVQDLGRTGYRHLGVGQAGVMDVYSASVANALVGNPAAAAVLEMTLAGPELAFDTAATIALCGASVDARLDGRRLPCWRRIAIPAASVLTVGSWRVGARSYLSVAGGIKVAEVLGSSSTDLRSGFGGMEGRALVAGDVLRLAAGKFPGDGPLAIDTRWVDPAGDLELDAPALVRVLPGHDALLDPQALFGSEWQVDAASNRQGLRLNGAKLAVASSCERISEPVMPGSIQLPADGRPIVLMADAQTHGGYPVIAHAILADQPRLAQLRPGERFRFSACTPAEARLALLARRQRLARIRIAMESVG